MLGSKDDLNSRVTVCFLLGDITKHSDCENIDCDKWYKGCLCKGAFEQFREINKDLLGIKFIFSICRIQNENVRLLLQTVKTPGLGQQSAECHLCSAAGVISSHTRLPEM